MLRSSPFAELLAPLKLSARPFGSLFWLWPAETRDDPAVADFAAGVNKFPWYLFRGSSR